VPGIAASPSLPARPQRRTQAERRAATREALLDAALECLLEEGYPGLTTRRVAERAGVSQGTQRYYYPRRAEFVAAAIERLAGELAQQVREQTPPPETGDRRRIEAALDQLWEINNGPLFQAMMELCGAARTDPELRDSLTAANHTIARIIARTAAELFPTLIAGPGGREFLDTAFAAMRGLAMFAPLKLTDLSRRWQATRQQLLQLYDGLIRRASPGITAAGRTHNERGQPQESVLTARTRDGSRRAE
jgi:AcrR family transcriptional regulator